MPIVDSKELEGAISQALAAQGLQKVDRFVNKVLQLFDTMNVRCVKVLCA